MAMLNEKLWHILKAHPFCMAFLTAQGGPNKGNTFFGAIPHPVTVTTRITTFLVWESL